MLTDDESSRFESSEAVFSVFVVLVFSSLEGCVVFVWGGDFGGWKDKIWVNPI
jgi:hypothetical protein